jgi:polyhydroxyalkanoate synthase
MYLENNLRVPGKLEMCGVKADLGKVDMPAYLLASREDHIVPWKRLPGAPACSAARPTFVLGASGHIAGAINPASKNKRSHWTSDTPGLRTPTSGWKRATEHKGSWWLHWANGSSASRRRDRRPQRKLGSQYKADRAAPGRYVKEKA